MYSKKKRLIWKAAGGSRVPAGFAPPPLLKSVSEHTGDKPHAGKPGSTPYLCRWIGDVGWEEGSQRTPLYTAVQ